LSRNQWLARALELLPTLGGGKIGVEALCRSLGVSRGSFYWHFRDREEFVRALLGYWDLVFTQGVIEQTRGAKGPPEDRLLSLMKLLQEGDQARYDMAVRAWAAQEPGVAAIVARVDEARLAYVRSIFAQIGFRGRELDMRTRLFVVYHSMNRGLQSQLTEAEEKRHLRLRHALLTRR
jgi:AcrR family transcriptional regulator